MIDDDVSAAITGKTPGSISVQVTKVREETDELSGCRSSRMGKKGRIQDTGASLADEFRDLIPLD